MSTLLKVGQTSVGQTSVGQMLVAEKSRHPITYLYCNSIIFDIFSLFKISPSKRNCKRCKHLYVGIQTTGIGINKTFGRLPNRGTDRQKKGEGRKEEKGIESQSNDPTPQK